MKPQFADTLAWQQAELLMQPVFIRLIDNIRKQLDQSTWNGRYQDLQIWDEQVPDEIKTRVSQLQSQLKTASPEEAADIEQTLATLPAAYPSYQLCLEQNGQSFSFDLWDLCYQICFQDYAPKAGTGVASPVSPLDETSTQPVTIDTSLIDETGDVDWNRLDEKAQQVVAQVFNSLPTD